eukprot:m.970052 g.970052  ORF g.970052 m.970052 type:complete len:130 (+) comp23922_c1_seq12:160-549(+)
MAKNQDAAKAASPDDHVSDDEVEVEETQPVKKTAMNESKEADKVTDYAEEKDATVDEGTLKAAMTLISANRKKEKELNEKRAKELKAVSVKKEDISLLSTELEVDSSEAEQMLREHNGDVLAVIRTVVA